MFNKRIFYKPIFWLLLIMHIYYKYIYIYIYIYRYIIYGMRRQNGHINTEYANTKIRPTILCQPPTLIYELLYVREIIGI